MLISCAVTAQLLCSLQKTGHLGMRLIIKEYILLITSVRERKSSLPQQSFPFMILPMPCMIFDCCATWTFHVHDKVLMGKAGFSPTGTGFHNDNLSKNLLINVLIEVKMFCITNQGKHYFPRFVLPFIIFMYGSPSKGSTCFLILSRVESLC